MLTSFSMKNKFPGRMWHLTILIPVVVFLILFINQNTSLAKEVRGPTTKCKMDAVSDDPDLGGPSFHAP